MFSLELSRRPYASLSLSEFAYFQRVHLVRRVIIFFFHCTACHSNQLHAFRNIKIRWP